MLKKKAMQQINFTGNVDRAGNTFFTLEEARETILGFYKELWDYFEFISL